MFKTPKVSPGEETSGGPRVTPKLGVSREFSLDSDPSELRSRGPLQRSSSKKVQAEGGPSRPPHVPQNATSWPCSAIGLLSICAILLLLVTLMNLKVAMLEKRTKEEADLWQWKMLTLTEILKDLQIGKVRNCSVCKVQWMQLSGNCYFFRNRQLSWHSSQTFCQEENADLTMVTNMDEMHFLKFHSFTHYYLDPKTYEYDKFWIGLAYDIVQKRWLWLDGTAFNPSQYGVLGDDGCAYIQNESLRSQPCHEVAKSICETTVQFGWSM